MGKVIAVYGAPGAGCTTFALKLAQHISHANKHKPVIFLSPDIRTPTLSVVFPHRSAGDLYSLGAALDRTDIQPEHVAAQLVTVKAMPDLGYLGYKSGENRYSYPRLTEDKAAALFLCVRHLADTVIVDCANHTDDLLARRAMAVCDRAIRLAAPDLKSICYFRSYADAEPSEDRRITVVNENDRSVYLPLPEAQTHFGAFCCLPYNWELRQQAVLGRLSDRTTHKAYCKALEKIAQEVGDR